MRRRAGTLGAALRVTDELLFSQHALGKMIERRIDVATARSVWEANDAIEIYPDDTPYPSALYLGWVAVDPFTSSQPEPTMDALW